MTIDARSIKNPDEVECLRICAAIGDSQMQTVKDMLKPGVKENQIMGAMHKTAYDLGGEVYSGMLVTSGPFSWPNSRYMTDRIIRPRGYRRTVYVDVYNTTYNGYHICYYRTFAVGKPPQQLVDQIIFLNQDITAQPQTAISHRGIAVAYQITNIFPLLSVFENVRWRLNPEKRLSTSGPRPTPITS